MTEDKNPYIFYSREETWDEFMLRQRLHDRACERKEMLARCEAIAKGSVDWYRGTWFRRLLTFLNLRSPYYHV